MIKYYFLDLPNSPPYNELHDLYIKAKFTANRTNLRCKKLFDHFLSTSYQLFRLLSSESNTAIKASSDEWINAFVKLYCRIFSKMVMKKKRLFSQKKYSCASIYWNNLSSISIYDYAKLVASAEKGTTYSSSTETEQEYQYYNSIKGNIENVCHEYLPSFFGIEYSNTLPQKIRYELICLVKILYDCSTTSPLMGKFMYILSPSVVKFSPFVETTYKRNVHFIKIRLFLRMMCSIKSSEVCISNIMYMEKYANALNHFLDTFPHKATSYVIKHSKRNLTCSGKRDIMLAVYDAVIKNTKKNFKSSRSYNYLKDPKAIAAYAYLNFLLSGVEGYFSPPGRERTNGYYPEASDDFYDNLQSFPIDTLIDNEAVLSAFIKKHKHDIISHIPMGAGTEKSKRDRLSNHMKYYIFLFTFFKECIQKSDAPLTGKDALYMIMFCETAALDGTAIPLYEGYTKTKKRSLTIFPLLKGLKQKMNASNTTVLSSEEYIIACLWLEDRMLAFWDMRTTDIQNRMVEMKLAVLGVWKKYFPYMTKKETRSPSLNEFVATLLPESTLKALIERT